MAPPAIDAYTFITLAGPMPRPVGRVVEDVSPPGWDGMEFRRTHKRSEPFLLRSVVDGAKAALPGLGQDYADLRGQKVTVLDPFGNSFTNVMVLDARPLPLQQILSGVGLLNAGDTLLSCEWTLQLTEDLA